MKPMVSIQRFIGSRLVLLGVGVVSIMFCVMAIHQMGLAAGKKGKEKEKKFIYLANPGYRSETGGPVVCTREGKLLWLIGGPDTGLHLSRVMMLESIDNGESWSAPRVFLSGSRERSIGSFGMICLASGKLLHIHARYGGYDHDNFENCINDGYVHWSTDNGATWSEPAKIPTNERYLSSVLSCTQLSNGRIIFPFGYLTPRNGQFVVSVVWSDDEGQTWKRSKSVLEAGGGGFESGACEPSAVELPDGRLWMLIRAQSGFQYESFSSDNGETWTVARPSKIPSSNAPAVLLRLKNGRIIVVWNNCTRWAYARYSLMMAATDDGENFFGFREIDNSDDKHVNTSTYWCVTYPYLCEGPNGDIFVSYNAGDWEYNQAKIARIDPDWLEETDFYEDFYNGRSEWCAFQSNAGTGILVPPDDNKPGSILKFVNKDKSKPCGLVRNIPNVSNGKIKITAALDKPEGYVLLNNSFLNPGAVDEAVVRVRFGEDGKVFVGAGEPMTIQNDTPGGSTQYFYRGYPVKEEIHYPNSVTPGSWFVLSLTYNAAQNVANISIDNGPVVTVKTDKIMGLCYMGIAAASGGELRIRRIETSNQ